MAITNRLNKLNAIGGGVIALLTLATTWGRWHTFTVVLGVQTVAMVYNFGYNVFFMARMRARGEMLRTVVNAAISLVVCYVADWPVSQWLVLPYLALVSEHSAGRHVVIGIAVVCVIQDMFAFYCHVPWLYPVAFTGLAWFCYEISRTRFGIITSMLADSDAQRTEVERAHARLNAEVRAREQIELELRQSQKLEAMGRLAAGVAHEINTPVQFVNDSVQFISEAVRDSEPLVRRYQALGRAAAEFPQLAEEASKLAALEDDIDLDYLLDHVPAAAARSLEGLGRIASIVRSLKEFAHPDSKAVTTIDLNQAIKSTLTIAAHEYKLVADLATRFGELPPISCRAGEINQVVLNLVVNASHAIADVVAKTGVRGKIGVATRLDGDQVIIEISDTGTGIPSALHQQIFEPFFTTKSVGKGTGQGLAIARTVVEKHGGKLTFDTMVDQGTTFCISLPLSQSAALAA